MDLNAVIADLRSQLEDINRVIAAVEKMSSSRTRSHGRQQTRLPAREMQAPAREMQAPAREMQAKEKSIAQNMVIPSLQPKAMSAAGS